MIRTLTGYVLAGALVSGVSLGATASDAPREAAPALRPAELMALLAAMPVGDPARGADLHRDYWCASCHGETGVSWSRNYPTVAGQSAAYVFKTLTDYRDGRRAEGDGTAESMAVTVRGLDDRDLADLAAYYAAQPAPAADVAKVETPPEILTLIRHGDPDRLMTACASCHGVGGGGGKPEVPRLAGLERDYLVRSLTVFHGGTRSSDTDRNMRFFADRLSADEIEALATHYAGLGRAETAAAE